MSETSSPLREITVPDFWETKVDSYLHEQGISVLRNNKTLKIKHLSPTQSAQLHEILEAISRKPFMEALLAFPTVEVEDLFLQNYRLPFLDLIPYLEELDKKGILFDFGEDPQDDSWVVDANDCVKVISQSEHYTLLTLENRIGVLLPRAQETVLAKEWFYSLGVNYLTKIYLSPDSEVNEELEHVLDFLNSFEREIHTLTMNLNSDPVNQERLNALTKERESLLKSSYQENLAKAPIFFTRLAKKLSKEEDWSGVEKVFEYKEFTVYQLLSEKSKDRESAMMQHCVGNGGYDLSSGIYSLRDNSNLPLATIEIDENGQIVQIQGFTNQKINHKALVPLRHFISDYLKVTPPEMDLEINTGWCKVSLNYPEFGFNTSQDIYFTAEELPIDSNNQTYSFDIKDYNWKEEIEKEFVRKNISKVLKEKIIAHLEANAPFVFKKSILGFNFDKALKIPNIKRFDLIEELATLIHENLKYFDEGSANLIRQINYDFKNVKNAKDAIANLTHLDIYFQKGLNTRRWTTLDSEELIDALTHQPQAAYAFYKKYLQLLKLLHPEALIAFEPSFWLEVFGSIFPDNLLEQPFLKMVEELREIAQVIDAKDHLKAPALEEIMSFSKMLNSTQATLLKKHIKNFKKEIKKLNQEMLLFISESSDFTSFFSEFNLHALDSFDFFILEEKPPHESKEFWLLSQQIKFVLFHLKKFKTSINSPSYQNVNFTFKEIQGVFSKIENLINASDLPTAKFPDEVNPLDILKNIKEEIRDYEVVLMRIAQITDPKSDINILAKSPSETIVLEILENWQDSFINSRVAKGKNE